MAKPGFDQRHLERLDQLVDRLDRLAAAIEQQNAITVRHGLSVEPAAGSGRPQRYYNTPQVAEKAPNVQTERQKPTRRRPRQAGRG